MTYSLWILFVSAVLYASLCSGDDRRPQRDPGDPFGVPPLTYFEVGFPKKPFISCTPIAKVGKGPEFEPQAKSPNRKAASELLSVKVYVSNLLSGFAFVFNYTPYLESSTGKPMPNVATAETDWASSVHDGMGRDSLGYGKTIKGMREGTPYTRDVLSGTLLVNVKKDGNGESNSHLLVKGGFVNLDCQWDEDGVPD